MLVSDITIFKKFIPTIVGTDFTKYEKFLADADNWLRKEIAGQALYDVLEVAGNETALEFCQAVVSYKAYGDGIPHFNLVENENGFAVVSTDKLAPASEKRVIALLQGTEQKLSDSIEALLEYLEETIDLHDEWKGSPVYSLLSDVFIHTVKEFRRFAAFVGGRMEFVAKKPDMLNAINLKIAPVISSELADQVIEQIRDNDLTPENSAILGNLRFAYANFVCGSDDIAESYLMKVRKELYAAPDSYQAFRDSDIYVDYLASMETTTTLNSEDSPLFFGGV
jgi:hypothetical protein